MTKLGQALSAAAGLGEEASVVQTRRGQKIERPIGARPSPHTKQRWKGRPSSAVVFRYEVCRSGRLTFSFPSAPLPFSVSALLAEPDAEVFLLGIVLFRQNLQRDGMLHRADLDRRFLRAGLFVPQEIVWRSVSAGMPGLPVSLFPNITGISVTVKIVSAFDLSRTGDKGSFIIPLAYHL